MFESHWILCDPAGRITLHPKGTAGLAAPDIVVDGEVVGYGVGIGRNLIDHLAAAGLAVVATRDPAGPRLAPLRDPTVDFTDPDPTVEAAYLAARARRLAGRLGADPDPELGLRRRGIVADVAADVTAVSAAVTALMFAIEKVKAALVESEHEAHPTTRAV